MGRRRNDLTDLTCSTFGSILRHDGTRMVVLVVQKAEKSILWNLIWDQPESRNTCASIDLCVNHPLSDVCGSFQLGSLGWQVEGSLSQDASDPTGNPIVSVVVRADSWIEDQSWRRETLRVDKEPKQRTVLHNTLQDFSLTDPNLRVDLTIRILSRWSMSSRIHLHHALLISFPFAA
jgi:hypothetical protein